LGLKSILKEFSPAGSNGAWHASAAKRFKKVSPVSSYSPLVTAAASIMISFTEVANVALVVVLVAKLRQQR
jgi:hypothetical protein